MRRNCAPEPAGSGDPDDSTFDDEESRGSAARGGSSAPDDRRRRRRLLRLAVIAVVGALFFAGVGLYRRHQDRRIVALSVARARHLVRSDTWNGYRDAADLLAIRAAALDRDVAGSLHSFALAMLSLDYRGDGAAPDARREAADAPPDRSLAAPSEMRLASA